MNWIVYLLERLLNSSNYRVVMGNKNKGFFNWLGEIKYFFLTIGIIWGLCSGWQDLTNGRFLDFSLVTAMSFFILFLIFGFFYKVLPEKQ